MAKLNLTPVPLKVNALQAALWKATPEALGRFIQRHEGKMHPAELTCVRYAFKAMQVDCESEATATALHDEWDDLGQTILEALPTTERAMEIFCMADSVIEALH